MSILSQKLADDEVTFKGSPAKRRGGIGELSLNQFSRRYIFHLLARLTAFTEAGSGRADSFDKYVDRKVKNPFDIEHIWADDFASHRELFASEQEFQEWRNQVASLLLLPADVNRSLQDKPYAEKVPHYATQNLYAASLSKSTYLHQPQSRNLENGKQLPFTSHEAFGKEEQQQRRELVEGARQSGVVAPATPGAAIMSTIGQSKRATQDRAVALFHEELGYRCLGDWTDRDGNSNIETGLLMETLRITATRLPKSPCCPQASHRGGQSQPEPLRKQQGRLLPAALRSAGKDRSRQGHRSGQADRLGAPTRERLRHRRRSDSEGQLRTSARSSPLCERNCYCRH